MKRYGRVIGIKASDVEKYQALHASVWPEVLTEIKKACIQNYSIYMHPMDGGQWCIFTHFEYTGDDLQADMAKIRNNPKARAFMKLCLPLFSPLDCRKDKENLWGTMEEVFYLE